MLVLALTSFPLPSRPTLTFARCYAVNGYPSTGNTASHIMPKSRANYTSPTSGCTFASLNRRDVKMSTFGSWGRKSMDAKLTLACQVDRGKGFFRAKLKTAISCVSRSGQTTTPNDAASNGTLRAYSVKGMT